MATEAQRQLVQDFFNDPRTEFSTDAQIDGFFLPEVLDRMPEWAAFVEASNITDPTGPIGATIPSGSDNPVLTQAQMDGLTIQELGKLAETLSDADRAIIDEEILRRTRVQAAGTATIGSGGVTQEFLDRIGTGLEGFNSFTDEQLVTLMAQVSVADQQVIMDELNARGATFSGAPKVSAQELDGGDIIPGSVGDLAENQRLLDEAEAKRQADLLAAAAGDLPVSPVPATGPGRFSQFLISRGIGASGGGPAGAFGRRQFDPINNLFNLRDRLGPSLNPTLNPDGTPFIPQTFAQYLATNSGGARQARAGGRDLLGSIFDLKPETRASEGLIFGNEFDLDTGLQFTREGGLSRTEQDNILRSGFREQFGTLGSEFLGSRLGVERDIFDLRRQEGVNTSSNFLDYLRDKYSLSFR